MAPEAVPRPAVRQRDLHLDPDTGQPAAAHALVKLVGKRLGREYDRLGITGWIELAAH